MRRISFIFILLLTWVTSSFAEDKLQVESFSISAGGTATLNIALSNPDAQYTALQADLYLPEGIDLEKQGDDYVYTLSRAADSHSLTIKKKTGYYRLLLSSVKNEEFSGNSGSLISLSLKAAAEISSETKTGYLKAIKIAKKDGSGLKINESAYNVSIVSIQITPPSIKTDLVYSGISQDLISKGTTSTGTMLYSTDGTNYSSDIPAGKDAKTYTIYYKVVDNSNKDIVTPVSLTVTIEKAALKISAGDYTITQGQQFPDFVAKYEGFKNNETEAVLTKMPTLTTTATSSSIPGMYEVNVSGAEAQNYDISYKKGTLIITEAAPITVTVKNVSRQYGQSNPTFEYTVEGGTLDGTPEISCSAMVDSDVGTYDISVNKGTVKNYNVTFVGGKLTITKAPLTIKVGIYTRKQGEDNPQFVLEYAGFKNGETETVLTKQPIVTCNANVSSAPGEYAVMVSGAEAQNYEISYVDGKLIVMDADAVVIIAKNYTREYGEDNPFFEFTTEGTELDGEPVIECSATATSAVGTYDIVITKGGVKNYNDTYVNGTLTITKAPLTIKAGTYTKKQGEENPEFNLTYEGFKNNETKDVLTKQPTVSCEATWSSAPGEYTVKVINAEAQNYAITCTDGKLIVLQADAVAIMAKSYSREYGDENPVFGYEVSGAELDGTPEISCEATVGSEVGTYTIFAKQGSVKNFNVSYINGTLTITKAPLKVSVKDVEREQGEENPQFELVYEGWKLQDSESVLLKKPVAMTTATKNSPSGDYVITVSGGEACNYELRYKNGKLTVTMPSSIHEVTESATFDIYDMSGRKVRRNVTTFEGLPKGIYIAGGRKVVLK